MNNAAMRPAIDPSLLAYDATTLKPDPDGRPYRWYDGDIRPGQVFAWEPDLPHARELLVVTRVGGPPPADVTVEHARGTAYFPAPLGLLIWSRPFEAGQSASAPAREVYNDEDRFREAVVPTLFKDVTP